MKICAMIPAYREEAFIEDVVRRVRTHLEPVVVYDDGSPDATAECARKAGAIVLRHEGNQGKGATLADGFDWAVREGFEAVVNLDGDGQHLPEEIPRFLAVASEYDVIVGNRMSERKGMPYVRWQTNRFTSAVVSWLAGCAIPDSQCGFRLIHTKVWTAITVETRNFDFESEFLVEAGRKGFRIGWVPVSTVYGTEVSKIHPAVDTIRFFRMVYRLWRKGRQR